MVIKFKKTKLTFVNQCKKLYCQTIVLQNLQNFVTLVNGNSVQVYTKCNGTGKIMKEQTGI